VARAASEDRLFSHEQARRFALAYTALTLLGLALAVPHWRVLGLLRRVSIDQVDSDSLARAS
jgi:hypothetical protein